jgi:maltose/maltodextrin transport system substrate-binding protein
MRISTRIVLGLAGCMVAAGLSWTAAAQPLPASASGLKLLIWINGDKGYNGIQRVGDAFVRETGVQVVVQHPEDAPGKFQQAAAVGVGPDIFCWPHDRLGEWAKSGLVVPIKPGKRIRDDIEPAAWRAFTYQGKTWGYPLGIEAVGLIYNKALVKTPPTSFDDIIRLDDQLAAKGKHAILWHFNKSFFTWPLMAGAGGVIFGRDDKGDFDPHKVDVNNAGAVKAAQLLSRLIEQGRMPRGTQYSEMESAFARGEVAMMFSGPWAWDNARRAKIDFGVADYPGIDEAHPGKPFVGVLGCMISAHSKVKDISREFLEQHLLQPQNLRIVNDDVPLGVPASKAFYAELATDPNIRASMSNAAKGEPIPNIPETGRFWTAMDAALEAITNGQQAPADALNGAAARMLAK